MVFQVFHGFGLVLMDFQSGFMVFLVFCLVYMIFGWFYGSMVLWFDGFSWFLVGFHGFSRWFHGFSWLLVGCHGYSRWFHDFSWFLVCFHGFSRWFHGFSWFLVGFYGFHGFWLVSMVLLVENTAKLYPGPPIHSRPCRP